MGITLEDRNGHSRSFSVDHFSKPSPWKPRKGQCYRVKWGKTGRIRPAHTIEYIARLKK